MPLAHGLLRCRDCRRDRCHGRSGVVGQQLRTFVVYHQGACPSSLVDTRRDRSNQASTSSGRYKIRPVGSFRNRGPYPVVRHIRTVSSCLSRYSATRFEDHSGSTFGGGALRTICIRAIMVCMYGWQSGRQGFHLWLDIITIFLWLQIGKHLNRNHPPDTT